MFSFFILLSFEFCGSASTVFIKASVLHRWSWSEAGPSSYSSLLSELGNDAVGIGWLLWGGEAGLGWSSSQTSSRRHCASPPQRVQVALVWAAVTGRMDRMDKTDSGLRAQVAGLWSTSLRSRFFKKRFYLFIFRERGREGEKH